MTYQAGGPCVFLLSDGLCLTLGVSESGDDIRIMLGLGVLLCALILFFILGHGILAHGSGVTPLDGAFCIASTRHSISMGILVDQGWSKTRFLYRQAKV